MSNEQKLPRFDLVGAIVVFFVGLFLFSKFGPSIPFTVSQVSTTNPAPFTVSAEGKVTAVPDVAEINMGFTTTEATVSQAQNQANQIINSVSAAVKKLGIGDKDIKTTNYSLYPTYDYRSTPQKITGYSINVNLTVKVRDFTKINQVIDAGTTNGANQIGGLNFTFDDQDKFKARARKIAIDNAKQKASQIAKDAGIRLGKLVNVQENSDNFIRPTVAMMAKSTNGGLGGGAETTKVEPGSSEITSSVTLSYETR
ncbi:SIMPL domain-containing protein [Candidatus Microgenomates bacterium]|nr:SIMPL domain-containing protein [Candidatus Microgenomates bacterium]